MKFAMLVTLALGTALCCRQDQGKKLVEHPVKKALDAAPEKFDLARLGIDWNRGLESALHKGKPILLFQLLGNFDDVYC